MSVFFLLPFPHLLLPLILPPAPFPPPFLIHYIRSACHQALDLIEGARSETSFGPVEVSRVVKTQIPKVRVNQEKF